MNTARKCTNCGSTDLIGTAYMRDGQGYRVRGFSVDANPKAMLLKEPADSSIAVCVCSACGHVELYAENVPALKAAFLKAQSL